MPETKVSTKVVTPECRVSFPRVFEAKAVKPGDKAKFSIAMLFRVDKETAKPGEKVADLTEMKNALVAAATEKWGEDKSQWPPKLEFPFRKGEEKEHLEGYEKGIIFCGASSINRPGVVDQNVKPIMVPSDFYAGCYAYVSLNAYAWEYMGKKGVSFGLQNVQLIRDGDPLGSRSNPDQDFNPIAGAGKKSDQSDQSDQSDPLAGLG